MQMTNQLMKGKVLKNDRNNNIKLNNEIPLPPIKLDMIFVNEQILVVLLGNRQLLFFMASAQVSNIQEFQNNFL